MALILRLMKGKTQTTELTIRQTIKNAARSAGGVCNEINRLLLLLSGLFLL